MSLILEALKKSETERRLGRAPGLMTPMSSERPRKRWNPVVVGTGALLILLLMGSVFGWMARDEPRVPHAIRDPGASATAASEPSMNSMLPVAKVVPAPTPARTSDGVEAGREFHAAEPTPKPPTPVAPQLREAAAPRDPEFESVERESVAVPAQDPPPEAAMIAPSAASVPTASLPSTPQPPQVATETLELPPDDLPRLHQLSASERDALPALKLSMHVYTESPEGRFVLIDGHRYGEGEKLAATLLLVEIQRNGIVLDFNGRRFVLQRP